MSQLAQRLHFSQPLLYLTEFDEDDPLAGLLSDEEDDPKPKKSTAPKKAGSPGISKQGVLTSYMYSMHE